MTDMITTLLILFLIYLFMLRGRTGHPKLQQLRKWAYAHRGLHNEENPENSMAAFRRAVEAGYGMELDVHLMADGNLAVIHDHSLKRTAGVDKVIEELNTADLSDYPLEGTQEKIPLFADMLKMVDGRTPLIVEIKSANGNHSAVTEAVCAALKDYKGLYCIESFDPRVVHYLRKHHPNIVRGQLAHNSLREKSSVPIFLRFLLTYNLLNFTTVPDFIAYRFCDRNNLSNFLCRKVLGIQGVSWTITDTEQYKTATEEGWIPIFERFEP